MKQEQEYKLKLECFKALYPNGFPQGTTNMDNCLENAHKLYCFIAGCDTDIRGNIPGILSKVDIK